MLPSPKLVHILTSRTCKYVRLNTKKDFADVIMLRIWRWEKVTLDYQGGLNLNMGIHQSRERHD